MKTTHSLSIVAVSMLLSLTACKEKTESQTANTPASQAAATQVAAASSPAAVPSTSASSQLSTNARVLSITTIGVGLNKIMERRPDEQAKACLAKSDLERLAPQIQAELSKNLSADDTKAFENLYSNGLGDKTVEFLKQTMWYALKINPTEPKMDAADQAKLQQFTTDPANAKYNQALMSAVDQGKLMNWAAEAVQTEATRCGLDVKMGVHASAPKS